MIKTLTCASFFAGVGGIDLGFEETGAFKTIYANEVDPSPVITFRENFPDVHMECKDIKDVTPEDFPDVDVIMGGFPCQAFSVAGYRKGFEDEKGRGTLFFELLRLIKAKMPRVIFLENVKNLVGHDKANTFRVITEALEDAGYKVVFKVMNAMDFGNTPQNRERIYLVGFREIQDFENFSFPEKIPLTRTIRDIIDFVDSVDEKYYYTPGKYKGELYNRLSEEMDDPDTVYQWRRVYVRKNQSKVVPTLTANMGEGGHNVPLVLVPSGIRKLTPKECFNAQGFPDSFKLPIALNDAKLYKQAGNSVCVDVIRRIADNISSAVDTHSDQ